MSTTRAIRSRLAGGGLCCNNVFSLGGAWDQREVERREDVLVYTSAPLEKAREVTGPIKVVLHASSSAPDTDFTAKLVDVGPCGYARNLTDGIIRARYRDSMTRGVADHARRCNRVRDRPLGNQQLVQRGPSDPGRDLQQQLSAL